MKEFLFENPEPAAPAVLEPTFEPVVIKPYVDPFNPANGKFPGGVPAASAAPAIYGQRVPGVDATFDLPPAAPSGFPPAAPTGFGTSPAGSDAELPDYLRPFRRRPFAPPTEPAAPTVAALPPAAPAAAAGDDGVPDYDQEACPPDYDDLAARFAARSS